MAEQNKQLKVLVGDDQIGIAESFSQRSFLRNYGDVAQFDFESDSSRFVECARIGSYDALLVDLHWKPEDHHKGIFKTGYQVLQRVRNYAPIRILHSSAEEEEKRAAFDYGATGIMDKYCGPEYMLTKLKGGRTN